MSENVNRCSTEITPNIENIRLIYLDNSPINLEIQSNLLKINPAAQFYTDIQLCLDVIKSICNEEIFFIISNNLSLYILDQISSFQSILAIFIYEINPNQELNDLKNQYPKIIDRYSNENDLFKSIEEKIQLIEKQIFVYSLFDPKQKFTQDLTKESASFLWHQMLIDILKEIPQNEISSDYFHQNYTREQAIQWYINDGSLYKLLNHALRTKNIELLYSLRFFILDLCFQIEKQSAYIKNQVHLIVYRAQIMSKEEIEKLKKYLGCLLSTNSFLVTSRNKNLFPQHFSIYENVLFEISIDLSNETILAADISCEQDILFNINSLFQINSIEYDTKNNLWNIQMTASNNEYLKSIQKEMNYHSSRIYFGHLLWNELGEINQADKYFQILLKSFSHNHQDLPNIYIELGNLNDAIDEYNFALKYYQSAFDIYEKQIPKDDIHLALSLNNMANVYKHMGNIDRAINYYRQSLNIYETKDENRANTLTNLGLAYRDKNDFHTALTYLTLGYNIRCDILPNNHPLLVNSLNSIGKIYYEKKDLIQALNYYQQALVIQERIYPNNHLNKANTLRNIALVYLDQHDWINALNYFNRTLQIREDFLSNKNHLDIAICYGDIGYIYEKMNKLDDAFDYYQKQYQIEELCLPRNHSNLLIHFDWIINILKKQDQFDQAIEFCQKKLCDLKILLNNNYDNHPRTARILVLLATIYEDQNPKQADQYYQKALTIFESNQNEDIVCKSLSTMTNFYWKCRMFDRALICQMKLLNLRRSTLLSNDQDIAYTLRDLGRLYRTMNKLNEALEYFEQSLIILKTNSGSECIDVKNIQKEIFDLKEILQSLSSSANEDYHNRRISNEHKQINLISQMDLKIITKPSTVVSKSSTCIIL